VKTNIVIKVVLILSIALTHAFGFAGSQLETGARVYIERCALCHGPKGLGEGVLPLLVDDYPSTSLRGHGNPSEIDQLISTIQLGRENGRHSQFSPPWKDELSGKEIRSVAVFVQLLQRDLADAVKVLDKVSAVVPSPISGKHIYRSRCASCHGVTGRGDGHLIRVVNNPLPSNLTRSLMPRQQVLAIVKLGGSGVNRSPQMPPWGQELSSAEISNVVDYIFTLREDCASKASSNCTPKGLETNK